MAATMHAPVATARQIMHRGARPGAVVARRADAAGSRKLTSAQGQLSAAAAAALRGGRVNVDAQAISRTCSGNLAHSAHAGIT